MWAFGLPQPVTGSQPDPALSSFPGIATTLSTRRWIRTARAPDYQLAINRRARLSTLTDASPYAANIA